MPLTYTNYLQLEELLNLQTAVSEGPEHDEQLFIIIHQVYELWFKQLLHELKYLQSGLEKNDLAVSSVTFKRILTILKVAVAQVDILETMTPLSFKSFRNRLENSSGFQSVQFREIEFLLGHRSRERLLKLPREMNEKLTPYLSKQSLYDSFLGFLNNNGHRIPQHILERDRAQPNPEDKEVQTVLIEVYRTNSVLSELCERMVDLDEGIQEWRYRHVKMVERTIGHLMGTGGSAGAQYLISTLFKPLFPDLWIVRSGF